MGYEDVKGVAKDLIELTLNGSPRWRLLVMTCIVGLTVTTAWGYWNYAKAEDVGGLRSDVTDIKVQLLSASILQANEQKCDAEKAGKYSPYWQGQLSKLRRDYFLMTGQTFELPPSC